VSPLPGSLWRTPHGRQQNKSLQWLGDGHH